MGVKLTWHGHSAFQIDAEGVNILIDPFFTGNPAASSNWESIPRPDLVLVTHLHGDHSGDAVAVCKRHNAMLGAVVGAAREFVGLGLPRELLMNGTGFNIGGTVRLKTAAITMTEAFHTSDSGMPDGYIVTLELSSGPYRIYHAGDTGIFVNMQTWGELYPLDLALLPTGGVFTMDAGQAALAAKYLNCKQAVPMHWGTFPALAQTTDEFVAELSRVAPNCVPLLLKPGQTAELK